MTDIYTHTYQISKPYIDNFRVALDVGARKAQYAKCLVKDFDHTHCFEPRRGYLGKFMSTLGESLKKATWHPVALGEKKKYVTMFGAVIFNKESNPELAKGQPKLIVKQKVLDDYNFSDVDYLKIDVEGHELNVLKGAMKTIERCKPLVVIEQNHITEQYGKGNKFDAKEFLESAGYEIVAFDGEADYILKYKNKF
jgi:FkbM family methyltransferase